MKWLSADRNFSDCPLRSVLLNTIWGFTGISYLKCFGFAYDGGPSWEYDGGPSWEYDGRSSWVYDGYPSWVYDGGLSWVGWITCKLHYGFRLNLHTSYLNFQVRISSSFSDASSKLKKMHFVKLIDVVNVRVRGLIQKYLVYSTHG